MNFSASSDYCEDGRFLQHLVIKDHISKLVFRPEDIVLDVGCGSGEETKSIARTVRSVTGVDPSDEMLAVASKMNSAPNVTYHRGDAQTVGDNPEWRKKFDKVVCFHVLHWVPDQKRAFTSILNCLKSGGEGLFIMVNASDTDIAANAYLFLKRHKKWGDYMKDFEFPMYLWTRSVSDTETLLKECGWTKARCEIHRRWAPFTEEQLKLFFKTCLGQSGRVPASEQEAYLDDLWQWAVVEYGTENDSGRLNYFQEFAIMHAAK